MVREVQLESPCRGTLRLRSHLLAAGREGEVAYASESSGEGAGKISGDGSTNMAQELVSSTRTITEFDILIDDDVAEDEVEIDYFMPRYKHRFTLRVKARDLFPALFNEQGRVDLDVEQGGSS